jgi:hypothetical protein
VTTNLALDYAIAGGPVRVFPASQIAQMLVLGCFLLSPSLDSVAPTG